VVLTISHLAYANASCGKDKLVNISGSGLSFHHKAQALFSLLLYASKSMPTRSSRETSGRGGRKQGNLWRQMDVSRLFYHFYRRQGRSESVAPFATFFTLFLDSWAPIAASSHSPLRAFSSGFAHAYVSPSEDSLGLSSIWDLLC